MNDNGSKQKEYLICGLGNPLLTDDAIGLLLLRKLLKRSGKKIRDKVDFIESHTGFMDLIDDFAGYKHVLIIDSIETFAGNREPLFSANPGISRTSLTGVMLVFMGSIFLLFYS